MIHAKQPRFSVRTSTACWSALACVGIAVVVCSRRSEAGLPATAGQSTQIPAGPEAKAPKRFDVILDWIVGAEDYGFFYALDQGYYESAELDVGIRPGFGAPATGKDLGDEVIYAGTVTSDIVLREWLEGARFSRVVPLMKFNPSVVAFLSPRQFAKLADLEGKTVGANGQSAIYRQWTHVLTAAGLTSERVKERSIGLSGASELKSGEVDAILAYTTNAVVELEIEGAEVKELSLHDLGVHSFGQVLVLGSNELLAKKGLGPADANSFVVATLKGFAKGAEDVDGAVAALLNARPNLDPVKMATAIRKSAKLNPVLRAVPSDLDVWASPKDLSAERRQAYLDLYEMP